MLFQKSLNLQKQDELMGYHKIMNMHAPLYHEFNSKLINSNMHAWNELQFTINDPNHDLALQSNMDHATINSKHEQEDNGATFSLVVQKGSSNMQSP